MYLITGATGNIGRELVPRLLTSGAAVRVLTRDAGKAKAWRDQAEIVVGDLDHPVTLRPALQGIQAIFLLTRGDTAGNQQVRHLLEALDGARPHIVLLSNLGAGLAGNPLSQDHALREQILQASGVPLTILRPGNFMSNAFRWARPILAEQTVYHPNADGRTAPIAPSDIAAVAARVLLTPDWIGQTLELTGPQSLSTAQQVQILAQALELQIRCVETSIETSRAGMIRAGMPESFADAMARVIAGVRKGEADRVTDTVEKVTGRLPISFADWAQAHLHIWKAAARV